LRVLVTGSTGFLGPHVIAALAPAHEIVSSSRSTSGPAEAALHIPHDFATSAPFPEVGRLDAIVHLAGEGNVERAMADPARVAQINALGTLRALDVARQHNASFVLASSQRVYRPGPNALQEDATKQPTDPYGYSKLAAEFFVEIAGRLFDVRGAMLRFFTIYGPGQIIASGTSGVVAILGQRATANQPMMVLSHQRKDLVEVSDAVQGIVLALEHPSSPPRPYNIATGVPRSVLDLARTIHRVADSNSEIVEDYSEGDPGDLVADIARARTELGYEPRVGLEEGLRRYVDWLRAASPHPAQSAPHGRAAR
jgi:UDP-glucose 4-epimerase